MRRRRLAAGQRGVSRDRQHLVARDHERLRREAHGPEDQVVLRDAPSVPFPAAIGSTLLT